MGEEFHSIRALSLMVKLALFEQRYYEASVLMHERTMRIDRWSPEKDSENLIHLTMLDTADLEEAIQGHISLVEENLRIFTGTADARKAYSLSQSMSTATY